MSHAEAVISSDFDEKVLQSDVPVLVDFWAVWCGPCKMIAPHVDALSQEYSGKARVYKVNIDDEQEITTRYGIMSIPTLLFFKDGKVVDQVVGAMPKSAISERLETLIAQ